LHGDRASFPSGLYHLVAGGETSWHLYAREVLSYAAQRGEVLKADPQRVLPIPASDYRLPAPRPANSRLNTARLRNTFGVHLPDWKQGIRHLLDDILS
jgi:dTDP-4-dehydrorhamnose reductase